jgi:hypothetical protein
MKFLVLTLAIGFASANAFATSKLCYGAKADDTTKGSELTADITQRQVTVHGSDYEGKYPFGGKKDTVNGKDGKTYLSYDVGGSEGCTTLLVDSDLLKVRGQGWIKFRCRGEGFGDSKFWCKPN